jgi:hypothetical protein
MEMDLEVEFSGAVMFAEEEVDGRKQVVALLLGGSDHIGAHHEYADRPQVEDAAPPEKPVPAAGKAAVGKGGTDVAGGHNREEEGQLVVGDGDGDEGDDDHEHVEPHYPSLVVNAKHVKEIHHLPARLAPTGPHRRHGLLDLTGLSLTLKDVSRSGVTIDWEGMCGIPFSRVIEMTDLRVDGEPARIERALVDRDEFPEDTVVVARVFLDAGTLHAASPSDRRLRHTLWNFRYKDGSGSTHIHLKARGTDRVVFHCRLPEAKLIFTDADGDTAKVFFQEPKDRPLAVAIRISSLPGNEAGGSVALRAPTNHFAMAYDVLREAPDQRPLPSADDETYLDPGANCFLHGRARVQAK